jgi:protein involved in polysaccharide export with SLBB domain
MKSGRQQLVCLPRWAALIFLVVLSGCFSPPKHLDNSPGMTELPINPAEIYALAYPDVLEVTFPGRSDQSQQIRIDPDGCVRFQSISPVHVEGDTCADAAHEIAELAHLRQENVHVEVAEFNSRQLFLFGQVNGGPRVVDYRGPEAAVDVLARTGGLSPSAATNEIYIVRAQMTAGMPTEVLTVDLQAIRNGDGRTNFRVQPLDEIYVGEMPRARIGKAIPTLFRPFYESLMKMWPCRAPEPTSADPIPVK